MTSRTIAIGDIHGCANALAAILDAIDPQPDDRIVVLGDCVDRGLNSKGVIEILLALQQASQLVTLLGNHELMMMRGLESESDLGFWLRYGGAETVRSYGNTVDDIFPEHIDFIQDFLAFFETDTHLFIHANYQADLPADEQPEAVAFWTHLRDAPPPPHVSGKTVIVGHTPQLSGEIRDMGHMICIDTCCFGGGWLTAMNVDNKDIWQANMDGELRK